jgi:glycosyltransferase involved in cell wall biosynthesis
MPAYSIGFIIEQVLGHITHTKNLQQSVPSDPDVAAHWGLIPYHMQGLASRIPLYNSNWIVRAGLQTRRMLVSMTRATPIDVLFFHTQVPAILASDWLRRIPSVVSLDATPLQFDRLGAFYQHTAGPVWLEMLKWRLNRDCYGAARHLVTWSEWARQGLIDEYEVPPEKVTVIPPGVDIARWACTPRDDHQGPVHLLFVGGDLERKGGLVLLEAFRALRPLGVELHLVTRDAVAPEPGLHVYHDMQPNSPELRALYQQADVFALPTYGDCLPMVLSEAGAAGLPVVSTRVAAIPEVVHDGTTGLLVEPGDAAALAQALRTLITQPDTRRQYGAQATAHIAQAYDVHTNARRLLALLKEQVDQARVAIRVAA